ncbi:MAG: TnsA endonuclease N-terminal domain-containing protein [Gemmatimonadetes bacterium]|nr:TnsA endonuclease N-terminal domain-containing protein [Gemmatimonadota bacterium]
MTGCLASDKAVGDAQYESTLERDLYTLLEFDPAVSSYEVQPVRIDYIDEEGKARHYTPDVLVHYEKRPRGESPRRPLLCEVKPVAQLAGHWREIRRKVQAARAFVGTRDWEFRVLTERHIRTPYLDNARFLLPFKRRPTDQAAEALLVDRLRELRSTDPQTLLAAVYWDPENRDLLIPSLWKLIAYGIVECDLGLPLTMTTRIWLREA